MGKKDPALAGLEEGGGEEIVLFVSVSIHLYAGENGSV
jgi:hypothetical protein